MLSSRRPLRGQAINDDAKTEFLHALRGAVPGGWLYRRRIVGEVREHLDECVSDLEAGGLPHELATRQALDRIGGTDSIAEACRISRSERSPLWRRLAGVRIAWVAVAAMCSVTAWAAELPGTSGARSRAPTAGPAHVQRHGAQSRGTCPRQARRTGRR